jgi:hypothetical protein
MVLKLIHRVAFYCICYAVVFYVCQKFGFSILGKDAFKIFAVLSIILGSIQSINLLVLTRLTEIQKRSEELNHFPRERVYRVILDRRKVTLFRFISGVLFAVLTGGVSAYMSILDAQFIPVWLLAMAITFAGASTTLLIFTLIEFYFINMEEAEMTRTLERLKRKEKALEDLKSE